MAFAGRREAEQFQAQIALQGPGDPSWATLLVSIQEDVFLIQCSVSWTVDCEEAGTEVFAAPRSLVEFLVYHRR